jgi:formylmethanofuran dehydrogenase subunit E
MGIKVNTGSGATTTETVSRGKLRCLACGRQSVLLRVNANGKMVCEECSAANTWLPAKGVSGASETSAR